MWQWTENQLKNIDSWKSQNLRDVHFAIFCKFVTKNFIKRELRSFRGLQHNEQQKLEHTECIAKELGENALLRVCEFLEIDTAIYTTAETLASKIIDAITFECDEEGTLKESHTSGVEEELLVLKQVEDVDTENLEIQMKILDQEKSLIELKQQIKEVENVAGATGTIDELNDAMKLKTLEVRVLQARAAALVSKKQSLSTKAKLIRTSHPSCSVKSYKTTLSNLDRVSKWVETHASVNQRENITHEDNCKVESTTDTNLQNTITNMLARQTLNTKKLEFDGSSTLEWRHFLTQFKSSSKECGFSPEEDVDRLNKSLRGKAREKVEIILMSAKEPSKILSILDNIYGRPETVALELMSRVRDIKPVREMEDFDEFNCAVQNINSALEFIENKLIDNQKLLSVLIEKLSESYLRDWGAFLNEKKVRATECKFENFSEWSQRQTDLLRDISYFKSFRAVNGYTDTIKQNVDVIKRQGEKSSCQMCNEVKHSLDKCNVFIKADIRKRWDYANKYKACYCCLKFHKGPCDHREMCKIDNCEKFHNKLLHKRRSEANASPFTGCISENRKLSLLKMVPVKVVGPTCTKEVIAFLDEGSTTTIMDLKAAREIGLCGDVQPFCFSWTGGVFRYEPNAEVANVSIIGNNNDKQFLLNDVHLINDLNLPNQQVNYNELAKQFPYINLANFQSMPESQPVLLIGQRHAHLITSQAVINGDENGPMLSKTKLGWVLHGPVESNVDEMKFVCCHFEDNNLQQMVKDQFSLESFGSCVSKMDKTKSFDDQIAVEKINTSITKTGKRFQVNLPWKSDNILLPDSRPMAEQRLKCLERKLRQNREVSDAYQREVQKLLSNGYARPLPNEDILKSPKLWFLPHFAVTNPNKPGKVRLVFDAAAECNGTSLNKNLLTGPDWLTSIVGILIRFRLYPIAYAGDIKEMFNQVQISDEDAASQCFLWRDLRTDTEPEIYQMKSMLFGTNSSPFIAQFIKNHNATMHEAEYPEATKSILQNHYVDDYLESKPSVEEAEKIIKSVIEIHREASFEIRNFISNSDDLMQKIPENLRSSDNCISLTDKGDAKQKVLGILWNASLDQLTFSTNTMHRIHPDILNGKILPTKRKILAAINSIYDPLGLITPLTLKGRIFMRDVWESGIQWDDVIKGDLVQKWHEWLKSLKSIKDIRIARCYSVHLADAEKVELHIFCDASSKAYSAAAYIRICYQKNNKEKYDVALIASRARVSPLKHVTIPKLETLAAVLGCRLAETIQNEIQIEINERLFWTDSQTTISWINSNGPMQTFIANRIGEICEKSQRSEWNWVSTTENIADIITRENFQQHKMERWLVGPKFLRENRESWPKGKIIFEKQVTCEPVMMIRQIEHSTKNEDMKEGDEYKHPLKFILKRVSTYNKVIRITGWVRRYIKNLKNKSTSTELLRGGLSVDELNEANAMWYRYVQSECFPDDVQFAKTGKTSPNLRLTKYRLCVDEYDVLRISGRTERAKDVTTPKPVILDGTHDFTIMFIRDLHLKVNHTGIQVVVHKFKNLYWMPKMNLNIKKTIGKCLWCRRRKSKLMQPQMGLLPEERFFTHQKPFTAVGIDYFGPFYTKDGRGTSGKYTKCLRKRYGVLFTCLTTRAMHVEIAHSLNTDSCIMAIRRIMARRGEIKVIWSDNGTNFRGAARELLEALEELNEQEIKSSLANKGIDWKFIPANAPNFGGCWERLVGCFKRALEAVLSVDSNPTDETLRTIFCEAEHLVNSRPYCLESDDLDDGIALCPNDILIQQNIALRTPGQFDGIVPRERRIWRVSQMFIDEFWKRFISEYIPTLINASKWTKGYENIREGDIVVMKGNSPRGEWPLGVVTKIFPGSDGVVRVVDVRTSANTYRRVVNHLCKLGLHHGDTDDRAEARSQH